jgi:hypothetical protein
MPSAKAQVNYALLRPSENKKKNISKKHLIYWKRRVILYTTNNHKEDAIYERYRG